jgi:hypothetical protein
MLRRFLALIALAGLIASLSPPRRADAGWVWNGHTWTIAIVSAIGAVAIGFFLKYESAMLRSKGSVKQGETVMNLTLFGTPSPGPSPDPHQLSLQAMRGIVMADIAYEITTVKNPGAETKWRSKFETLRSCWNTALVTPATPSPSSSPSPTASPTSSTNSKKSSDSSHKSKKNKKPPSVNSIASLTGYNVVAYISPHLVSDAIESETGASVGFRDIRGLAAYAASPKPPQQGGHHHSSPQSATKPSKKPKPKPSHSAGPPAAPTSSPSPSPSPSPTKPTCSDLFNDVLADYQGDVAEANKLLSTGQVTSTTNLTGAIKPSPLSTTDAENLAFNAQTQIDSRDLAAYLSTSPSLLAQVTNENVGTYVTDDYVRNLFLATAAVQFIDSLPTPTPPPTPTPAPGKGKTKGKFTQTLSTVGAIASDCSGVTGVTSGIKCLSDVSSVEEAYENAHIQREGCYWSKHVIMPTFSDIQLWAEQRGPYNPLAATALGKSPTSTPPPTTALITIPTPDPNAVQFTSINPAQILIKNIDADKAAYKNAQDAVNSDMTILTVPPNC